MLRVQTCLSTKQLVAGCEKLLQKVESSSISCNKSEKVARFTGLRQTCFALSDVFPVYTVTPLFYYSRNLQDRFERGW